MYIVSYNCFLLKSFIAISNPKIDMATESKAGIIKSDAGYIFVKLLPCVQSNWFRSHFHIC